MDLMRTRRLQMWMRSGLAALGMILPALSLARPGHATDGWLPENISTYGGEIDHQFWLIMGITIFTFFLTMAIFLWALIKFRYKEGHKSNHIHGSHKLELIWTLIPAGILLFLAIYQTRTWSVVKAELPEDANAVQIQVFAKQFEWNFRYAGTDGVFDTEDDPCMIKELYVPVDRPVVLTMRSLDVIHSLFLPHLRFKQDLMPGMTIKAWFEATKTTEQGRKDRGNDDFDYEIACTELCGIEHHTMKGEIKILTADAYANWLKTESENAKQFSRPEIWDNWERAGGEIELPVVDMDH